MLQIAEPPPLFFALWLMAGRLMCLLNGSCMFCVTMIAFPEIQAQKSICKRKKTIAMRSMTRYRELLN